MNQEHEPSTIEKQGRRSLILVAAIALILIAVLVLIVTQSKPQYQQTLEKVVRAGSAEFDSYRDKVKIEIIDKIEHPNLVGMSQYEVQARLTNEGDRTITGIEMAGKILGLDDQIIRESISLPIPRLRSEPLKPGESMKVAVKIDRPGNVTDADVKDLLIELRGLQFE
ncbi:MAG: hypothetical protein IPM66_13785 [Acidobacteriota bacterium]|nr:MAG: hypothetical protein IPM66_13785 [Acidobacteriota bacterium]